MTLLSQIKYCTLNQKYEMTSHAKEEMEDDNLTLEDIKTVIIGGKITKKLTHDLRGTRYEITGFSLNKEKCIVVGRFLSTKEFRIITVYKV